MTLENNNVLTTNDDIDTTAPQSKPAAWSMPAPVFRRTSGKLPGSFVKDVVESSPSENSIQPAMPDTSPSLPNPLPEPRPSHPTLKIVVVLLGLAAMIAFLIVFLSVVYYFFLRGNTAVP